MQEQVDEGVSGSKTEEEFISVEPPEEPQPTKPIEEKPTESPEKVWFEEIPEPTKWYQELTEKADDESYPVKPTEYYSPYEEELSAVSAFHAARRKRDVEDGTVLVPAFSYQVTVGHIQLLPALSRERRYLLDSVTDQENLADEPIAVSGMTNYYMNVYNPGEIPQKHATIDDIETGMTQM